MARPVAPETLAQKFLATVSDEELDTVAGGDPVTDVVALIMREAA